MKNESQPLNQNGNVSIQTEAVSKPVTSPVSQPMTEETPYCSVSSLAERGAISILSGGLGSVISFFCCPNTMVPIAVGSAAAGAACGKEVAVGCVNRC